MAPIATSPPSSHVDEEVIAKQNAATKELTPLQAISQGVSLPGIPSFTSYEKHRHWILEHMAGAFRVMARKGFCEGMSGHIRYTKSCLHSKAP
jgi:hypothetical protein